MNIECVICLENLQVMEDVYSTPCGHVFHCPCISQWFERSSTCPECRKEVPGKKLARIFFNFVNENTFMGEFTLPLELEIKSLRDQLMVKDGVIAQGIMREQDFYDIFVNAVPQLLGIFKDYLEAIARNAANSTDRLSDE